MDCICPVLFILGTRRADLHVDLIEKRMADLGLMAGTLTSSSLTSFDMFRMDFVAWILNTP